MPSPPSVPRARVFANAQNLRSVRHPLAALGGVLFASSADSPYGEVTQHFIRALEQQGESEAAALLRKVEPRSDAEARTECLQQDCHQVGEQRDCKERVAKL